MRGVSAQHRAVFFRCLATLFESGVPLVRSFELLGQQTEHAGLAEASTQVAASLAKGHTPVEAMQRHPSCFTALHVALVRVGQRSGALGQVFNRLAMDEEQRYSLRQRLRASLVVPMLVSAACLLLITLVAPLVLGSVLQHMGMKPEQMPWMTRILVTGSSFLRSPFTWLLAVAAGAVALPAWRRWQQDADGRLQLARRLDGIVGLGWVLRLGASTQFLRTLETTLSVGFPLLESLRMAAEAAAHPLLLESMPGVIEAVKEGEELHVALQRCEFFPGLVGQGIQAGQESGSLVLMLRHLAKILQLDLDQACETFSVALEPLVIGLVGVMVGFCVVATLLPMVKLVDVL